MGCRFEQENNDWTKQWKTQKVRCTLLDKK